MMTGSHAGRAGSGGIFPRVTIRQAVADAVVEVCGTSPDLLVDEATLASLDIDSLDLIEIGMIVETEYGITVESEAFDGVETFGAAVAVFERILT
jgi:acyl carrier protein